MDEKSMRDAFEKWEREFAITDGDPSPWTIWQAALAPHPGKWNPAPWAVQLPVITDAMVDDFEGTLIRRNDTDTGWDWTQTAVDFAGLLQGVRQAVFASRPTSEPVADRLFAKIAHGDDKHREWLRNELNAFFAGNKP